MITQIIVEGVYRDRHTTDSDMAELGKKGGSERGEVIEKMFAGEEVVGGVWTEEGEGFAVDLAGGEKERWESEGRVGEGRGAEVGDVDLVADFAGEVEETGEGLRGVSWLRLLIQSFP